MFRLPFTFIFTGIISFVLFHVLTLADFSQWITGMPRNPDGWFRVHLIVLGWASMIAMGAVYQLIHVVLQRNVYSERLEFVHYALFTVGTTGLLVGFHQFNVRWIALFAVLAFSGILAFACNIAITLRQAGQWNPITLSTAAGVLYLVLNGASGMTLGLDFRYNFLEELHERLFMAHVWLGTIGWFGLLITGFSYKMLPMFYLAHDYPEKLQYRIWWTWNGAVWCGAAAFIGNISWLKTAAFVLFFISLVLYWIHMEQIRKHRHKRSPGLGIAWAVRSLQALTILTGAGTVLYLVWPQQFGSMTIPMVWLYLYGWVAVTILGYLSKIAPFLWWTHKYGPWVGKKKVPTMAAMLDEKPIGTTLLLLCIALAALVAGMFTGQHLVIGAAGNALSMAALFYIALIARVFTK